MKKFRFTLIGIITVFFAIHLIKLSLPIKYNNHTSKEELLVKSFSVSEIQKIKDQTDVFNNLDGHMPIRYIKKSSCFRSTSSGGYGIYPQKDGGELYVFFDESERVYGNMFIDEFITSEEFICYKESCSEDILNLGGYIRIPYASTGTLYYFFLKDGMAQVRFFESELTGNEKPYIFELFSEEECIDLSKQGIPYILPIDRNKTGDRGTQQRETQ